MPKEKKLKHLILQLHISSKFYANNLRSYFAKLIFTLNGAKYIQYRFWIISVRLTVNLIPDIPAIICFF